MDYKISLFLFVAAAFSVHGALYEGDICSKDGTRGVCINIRKCKAAIDDIKRHKNPQICSFAGSDPVVCCVTKGETTTTTTQRPVATTQRLKPSSTTEEYVPLTYDYTEDGGSVGCPPIAANLTSARTGRKAWDKCLEYQEQLIYPCETSSALTAELVRGSHCRHNSQGLVVGGTDTAQHEFPHMVQLGYGTDTNTAAWVCGGSLISEKFVLTAGHCTFSREYSTVKFVKTGSYRRSEEVNLDNIYKIIQIHRHDKYKPPSKYNDIALLETERPMKLSQYVVPACVDTGPDSGSLALATGWGLTEHKGAVSDVLQKVTLNRFSSEECAANFPPERNMAQGFQEATQVCYGHKTEAKDTCQGDSGGPMQVYNKKIDCMYTVVGVTSFGKKCGLQGVPAIYTRVSAYTSWIESVVWP